jgi:alkylation response protein AidB-like acyl-CoA dehydrogenase
MNFDFSEDQQNLRSEARRFLEARCPVATVRAVLDDGDTAYNRELWTSLVEQGWTALTIPEAYGGLGMGRVDLCVLAEELGRVLAPVPFASTMYILAEALMIAGTAAQKTLLADIVQGTCIGCLAISEGPGDGALANLTTSVANGRLTGTKVPVTDGMTATTALVAARSEGVVRLFLVDLDQPGVVRQSLQTLDPSRDLARIEFTEVHCEPIGDDMLIDRLLDGAAALFAFEQLGGADRCLELAVEFAGMRYAFGRPIGSQQAIKHKLADMYAKNQIARSNAYFGAWALEHGNTELPLAAAAARVSACDAFWFAARESIQTHGGIGFTWEADQHLFYRRALQLDMVIGAVPIWRERLVTALEQTHAGDH